MTPPSPAAVTDRPWRLTAVLTGVDILAVAVLVATAVVLSSAPTPPPVEALGVIPLFALGDAALLHLRFGHNTASFTFGDLVLVLGLAVVPLPWLLLLAPLGVALPHLLARRAATKVMFNAASFTIGLVLAAGVCQTIGGRLPGRVGPTQILALALASLVFAVWNHAAVATAVALSQRLKVLAVARQGLLPWLAITGGNTTVGLVVIVLWQNDRQSVLLLPPVLILVWLAYRGYLTAVQERDHWRQLEEASKDLSRLAGEEVATVAATRAHSLLRADRVEVELTDGRVVRVGPPPMVATPPTVHVHPLGGPAGPLGELRLIFDGAVALDRRERQLLATFAQAVSVNLLNSLLFEQVRAEAQRQAYEANHDGLTGLANRSLLLAEARRALADDLAHGKVTGLLLMDLDHFKEINDTLGHGAGDILLRQVATLLTDAVGDQGLVSRLGGDEFAVILPGLADASQADQAAVALLVALGECIHVEGLQLTIEGSVGVACAPEDGATVEELLQKADVALYQAKDVRGSVAHYRPDRDDFSVDRLALAGELRGALEMGQLLLHFQPQIDIASQRIVGVEALVRWMHPTRGLLLPGEFVPIAEHSGLVRPFTRHVLERAAAAAARWRAAGRTLTVAVNLSARNLLDRQLPADVAEALARHGLPASSLILEITETTVVSELDVVEDVLADLRSLGVALSVDDFGTGYSSLAVLRRVDVHELKVDRSLVSEMLRSSDDAAIVRATVDLGHSMGLRVVAEGVEDAATLAALRLIGCDVAQGYHLGRAVTAPEIDLVLAESERPAPVLALGVPSARAM